MAEPTLADLLEEKQRRSGQVTGATQSVLAPPEETTTFEEFKRATESLLKGSAVGIINAAGGWGTVYDKLKEDKTASALSGRGIVNAIAKAGGPDLMKIQGYKGLYDIGQGGAPAALMSGLGFPGLFGRTAAGLAGEAAVAGGTGLLAQTIAPESALAQFIMQSSPYAIKGAISSGRALTARPEGTLPANADDLSRVGPMTPGEMTGNRIQLAKEAVVEASPKILEKANVFRQGQAQGVDSFLTTVINKATTGAETSATAAPAAIDAFNNYGKALSSRLKRDAARDFGAAKNSGGRVDTAPILSVIDEKLASLPPEIAALDPMRNALNRIKSEYTIAGTPATSTPSLVLSADGTPASVTKTAAVPAGNISIDIDRLQKNLSIWGDAVYSGKADFGKGNIFEGVAQGQVKGVAISILNGFRNSLDEAIASGVPGADKLVKARDGFKANLANIEEFSNRPLAKYFDVPTASALTPELVLDKLSKAKPSERAFLAEVLNQHPDGAMVLSTVRKTQLEAMLEKGRTAATGASEGSANINLTTLLRELNNKTNTGDMAYLLPVAKDRAEAALALTWLQKVTKTASGAAEGTDPYVAAKAAGGTTQQGMILREVAGLKDALLNDPNVIANVVFNKDTINKLLKARSQGSISKTLEVLQGVAKVSANIAVRAGPRLGSAEQPTIGDAAVPEELQMLLDEQARRKGQSEPAPTQAPVPPPIEAPVEAPKPVSLVDQGMGRHAKSDVSLLEEGLARFKQTDPSANIDYIRDSYRRAPKAKKTELLSLLAAM